MVGQVILLVSRRPGRPPELQHERTQSSQQLGFLSYRLTALRRAEYRLLGTSRPPVLSIKHFKLVCDFISSQPRSRVVLAMPISRHPAPSMAWCPGTRSSSYREDRPGRQYRAAMTESQDPRTPWARRLPSSNFPLFPATGLLSQSDSPDRRLCRWQHTRRMLSSGWVIGIDRRRCL